MGAPLGAEPAGDFAEDHARPQGTLAVIVGGGDIAAGDEDKEIAAAFADAADELLAGLGGGADGEQPVEPAVESGTGRGVGAYGGQPVEPAVEIGTVLGEGGVSEIGTAATDADGALQQLVKARSEAGISGVDGV